MGGIIREKNMPLIYIKETEPFDIALRRFKRICEKAGIVSELRKREFYEKPTWKRKRKKSAAIKRSAKQAMKFMTIFNKKNEKQNFKAIYSKYNKANRNIRNNIPIRKIK